MYNQCMLKAGDPFKLFLTLPIHHTLYKLNKNEYTDFSLWDNSLFSFITQLINNNSENFIVGTLIQYYSSFCHYTKLI